MSTLTPNTVIVHCDGIMCDEEIVLPLPPGWTGIVTVHEYKNIVFCPKPTCQLQDAWFSSQCPGCVGGYSDCALGRSFLYSNRRTITPEQIAQAHGEWLDDLEVITKLLTGSNTDLFRDYPFDGDFALGLTPAESLSEAIWWLYQGWRLKLEH